MKIEDRIKWKRSKPDLEECTWCGKRGPTKMARMLNRDGKWKKVPEWCCCDECIEKSK